MKRSLSLLTVVLMCGLVATAASHDIVQKDKQFVQKEVTIHVGESVNFKNRDTVTHHLFTSTPKFSFNFMEAEDEDKVVKFPAAGDYTVRCAIHPNMVLTVHVLP